MQMTDSEIMRNYEHAEDQKKQIGILADLNDVSRKEMADKLTELGYEVKPKKAVGGRPKREPIDELRAKELYDEGLCDLDIAECLGEPEKRVAEWRRRMKLKKNTLKAPKPVEEDRTEEMPEEEAPEENPEKLIREDAEDGSYMTAGTLADTLSMIANAYPREKVEVCASGADGGRVRDLSVTVDYGCDGSVKWVSVWLWTE